MRTRNTIRRRRKRRTHRDIINNILVMSSILVLIMIGFVIYNYCTYVQSLYTKMEKLESVNSDLSSNIKLLEDVANENAQDNKDLQESLKQSQANLKLVQQELNNANETIRFYELKIKNNDNKPIEDQDLSLFKMPTEDELNQWIKDKAPEDSPFLNRADVFIDAAKASGLNPKYIIAHAAVESSWGKSNICQNKGNYFGIAVYNHNTDAGYTFVSSSDSDKLKTGIVEGAKWISTHYTKQGQNTLSSMIYGAKAYAEYDNGEPNQTWLSTICQILKL